MLYGSESWTLSKRLEKRLDRTYTRLLMRVQNLSWRSHHTKQLICRNVPSVSTIVKARTVQFAGHSYRAGKEVISSLLLWKPSQSRGRSLSCASVISRDNNIIEQDLGNAGPRSLAQHREFLYFDQGRTMMMMVEATNKKS